MIHFNLLFLRIKE